MTPKINADKNNATIQPRIIIANEHERKTFMSELQDDELKLQLVNLECACRRWKTVGFCSLVASAVTLLLTASGIAQLQPTVPPREASKASAGQNPIEVTGIPINYVNFAQISDKDGEELFLTLGINPLTQPNSDDNIKVTNKFVMSFYTAKRLQQGFQIAVERHEKQFGSIETDAVKRSRPAIGKDPTRKP